MMKMVSGSVLRVTQPNVLSPKVGAYASRLLRHHKRISTTFYAESVTCEFKEPHMPLPIIPLSVAQLGWDRARAAAIRGVTDRRAIEVALEEVGSPPVPPLEPLLTRPEPTYEGLLKYLDTGQPSVGIFASEGGQFIAGHGMSDDAK